MMANYTGYVVPKIPLELVGRYGLVRNIYGAKSSMISADEAGGGLNWYFVGHDLKLQVDYFRLWDATMGATPAEALRHGTDRMRIQLALVLPVLIGLAPAAGLAADVVDIELVLAVDPLAVSTVWSRACSATAWRRRSAMPK